MHYHPCGKAVDIGRRPYRPTVRPFRDSEVTVTIDWVPARPEDGTLPFPSAITSLDWHARPWEAQGVGEVYGAPRVYNRKRPIPGPVRDHICGTADDFARGELLDASKPLTRYLPSGLPTCCDTDRLEAVGGIGVGGAGRLIASDPRTASGGIGIGGASVAKLGRVSRAAGGIGLGDTALSLRYDPSVSSGGIGLGDTALSLRYDPSVSSGGIGLGGSSQPSRYDPSVSSGGIGLGGTATAERLDPYVSDGGVGIGRSGPTPVETHDE
jgi:hypothetical protein